MNLENSFFKDIVAILTESREKAYVAVNTAMVQAYWQTGKRIFEEEQKGADRAEYGALLIPELSHRLTRELGKGFSIANLKNFRQFYQTFPLGIKSYEAGSQLSWTHYRLLMRVENIPARNWYLQEAAGQNWSTTQLDRNISTLYYDRLLSSSQKSEILLKKDQPEKQNPADFIKDPFVLEFLNIPDPINFREADLESNILTHLQHFLLELGKGFSFVGRQYHINTETSHFYLDLVFYNYILKAFVLFDLKTGRLTHQDVGQMDMYVRMFDHLKKSPDDNQTIGIILCADKDETVVKYSILNGNDQLFASKYRIYLPTEQELIDEIKKEQVSSAKKLSN
jgi:predicted nuclease of restriction endonuclease-like (RecB) superfamily